MSREEKAAMLYMAICSCFKEDNEIGMSMSMDDMEADFFEAAVASLHLLWKRITGESPDILDFMGILNKIVVQGLLERNVTATEDAKD